MIRIGIVGMNYGRHVLLPAFRSDSRYRVTAIAGHDPDRTAAASRETGAARAPSWQDLVDHKEVDAVAIAVPPKLQPEIAIRALRLGKPVFAEKPLAPDLQTASAMLSAAGSTPTLVDFGFTEVMAWRKAKSMLDSGAIGRLRHVVVNWQIENYAAKMRLRSWKANATEGGGAVGNFVSHSAHYLEWFNGPIAGLSARLSGFADDPSFETNVALALAFQSGASGSLVMSCSSYLGGGHRLEFFGEDGTLVLANPTSDYMRGFNLLHAARPATMLSPVPVDRDGLDDAFPSDGRIAPVARLAGRFAEAILDGSVSGPAFDAGCRAQYLLDAIRRSHDTGRWLAVQ